MFVYRSLTNCMHIFNYLSGLKISRALAEIKRYLITLQVMLFFFHLAIRSYFKRSLDQRSCCFYYAKVELLGAGIWLNF